MASVFNTRTAMKPSLKPPAAAPSRSALQPRYVRLRELRKLVPFAEATIWRKSRDGSFPAPVKLSARITAWNLSAVEAWLAEKEAA
jgi:prophage regulatory protein